MNVVVRRRFALLETVPALPLRGWRAVAASLAGWPGGALISGWRHRFALRVELGNAYGTHGPGTIPEPERG
jgi:hypothetical protein